MESRERMEQMMEEQYNRGITVGMELMMEKLRIAADNGTPIEIDGRAWYLKSDIENLRDIFEDMEKCPHFFMYAKDKKTKQCGQIGEIQIH